jgi:hypothetical protein
MRMRRNVTAEVISTSGNSHYYGLYDFNEIHYGLSLLLLTIPATAVVDEPAVLTGTFTHVGDGDTI